MNNDLDKPYNCLNQTVASAEAATIVDRDGQPGGIVAHALEGARELEGRGLC